MNQGYHFIVGVYVQFSGVFISVHELCGDSDCPDCAEYVVYVRVSDEYAVNVLQAKARVFQPVKYDVSSAGVG